MLSCTRNVVGSFTHAASSLLRQTTSGYALSRHMPFRSLSTYSPKHIDVPTSATTFSPVTTEQELSNKVNSVLSLYKEGLKILLPTHDPHSGPVCLQGSVLLATLLRNLKGLENIQIKGSSSGSPLYVHQHVFIVCSTAGEELIIDPSYQQFLTRKTDSKGNQLPSVFVGPRDKLYKEFNHQLGPDKRTYYQKLLNIFGLDKSPASAPQVIEDNYRCAGQEIDWENELCNALDMLKQGKSASEVAEYCYDKLTISRSFSTISSMPEIYKGFFGSKEVLTEFFTWAKNTIAK